MNIRNELSKSLEKFGNEVTKAMLAFHNETGFTIGSIDIMCHRSGSNSPSLLEANKRKIDKAIVAHIGIVD